MIEFTVFGDPKSKRISEAFFNPKTKKMSKFSPKSSKDWEQLVRSEAQRHRRDGCPWEGSMEMAIHFYFDPPKSVKRKYPHVKPDLDKCVRSIFDALSGTFYHDDAQVVKLISSKNYGTPRVSIEVGKIEEGP